MKKLPTVGGGTLSSHTLPPLGRYAPSGLVASFPRKDCAPPPNVLAHYATGNEYIKGYNQALPI